MPKIDPSSREDTRLDRQFGLTLGPVLTLLGGWWLWRGAGIVPPVLLLLGISLVLLALLSPRVLALPRYVFTRLMKPVGEALTWISLGLVYYLILTPLAIAKRSTGWDPLGRRSRSRTSSWQPYPASEREPEHFDHMY